MINADSSYKSGFVAVMGRPNVGKSTLINALLGQKVTAVSPRPQTTRKSQMGILTITVKNQKAQVVFIDTPGIHNPMNKLGDYMNKDAVKTLEESDVILLVVDASAKPNDDDQILFKTIEKLKSHKIIILALNKIDLLDKSNLSKYKKVFLANVPNATPVAISATKGINLNKLLDLVIESLPYGFPFFDEDQITDLFEREIAADLIREAALNILHDEVPHGIAVRIDQYTERNYHGAYIESTIFVEKESHKSIVIGANGRMIKKIGTAARIEIEKMSGRKVFLHLKVKVRKNWRSDERILQRFGY